MITDQNWKSKILKRKVLEIELRFKDESNPLNREAIFNRMAYVEKGQPLNDYFREIEKINRIGNVGEEYYSDESDKDRHLEIVRHKFRLGLDIIISSSKYLQPKEMLDAEKLNNFILNGKI